MSGRLEEKVSATTGGAGVIKNHHRFLNSYNGGASGWLFKIKI